MEIRAQPAGDYCQTYWERMQTLAFKTHGMPCDEFALRFCAYAPGVCSAIVGTASVAHLRHNIALVESGSLAPDAMEGIGQRYRQVGEQWSWL